MNKQDKSIPLNQWLDEWDPLDIGPSSYDTEKADIMGILYISDNPRIVAEKIKEILEFSFGETISTEKSLAAANMLLLLKNDSSCSI
ncbi:hypothetical protein JOC77_003861 [Peribacillus deserti]|uniref:DUF1871 domain-containing protein n=1 Tax=Peribacillus deserti TaxID=673318 RepID=A0ABS2QMJ6_9BACI|nr:DUF1871 family protein [Peribacillus deserti]MBM7694400.1 hypothetical protein [Peribacillus deserti]